MTNQPPVKQNEQIEVKIESIGRKGDGVAKYNSYIIMIPQSQIGQTYKVKITDVYPTYAFAIIIKEETKNGNKL